jgi:hypothetical protein
MSCTAATRTGDALNEGKENGIEKSDFPKFGKTKPHFSNDWKTDEDGGIEYEAGFAWGKAGLVKDAKDWEAVLDKQTGE